MLMKLNVNTRKSRLQREMSIQNEPDSIWDIATVVVVVVYDFPSLWSTKLENGRLTHIFQAQFEFNCVLLSLSLSSFD